MADINSMGGSPETRAAFATILAHALDMAGDKPLAIGRVAALFENTAMRETLLAGLLSIVPAEPDFPVWECWFSGGPAPGSSRLVDPEMGQERSARGAQQSAAARLDGSTRKVEKLKADLADAQTARDACVTEMRLVSTKLRAAVFYRASMIGSELTDVIFAMGPAWTMMRAVSAHLRTDIAWEEGLSDDDKAALVAHRDTRAKGSARILDLLDFHCGDVALEWKMHEAILSLLEAHHAPIQAEIDRRRIDGKPLSAAAKRTFRRAEERRRSIRVGAPISDRHEVFDGLRAGDPSKDAGAIG